MNLTKLQTKSLNKFKDLVEEIKIDISKTYDHPYTLLWEIGKELTKLMSLYLMAPVTMPKPPLKFTIVKDLTKLQTKSLNKFKDLVEEIKINISKTDEHPYTLLWEIEKELTKLMSLYLMAFVTMPKPPLKFTIVKDL